MREDLLKIINHYGIYNQLRKFNEESFELEEAIIRHDQECYPNDEATKHIKEEIADVLVMLNQFIEYYEISYNDIDEIIEQKVERQLERIKKENEI